jgi:hypothetical protein
MKSAWRQIFKNTAAQAARTCGVEFAVFRRDWGLQDFLLEAFDRDDSPQEIAARALDQLCVKEDPSRDMAVCLTVAEFLNETVGLPTEDPQMQRLRDLRRILATSGTYIAYLEWARSWYP